MEKSKVTAFHLIVLLSVFLGVTAKMYHDLSSEREQRQNNTNMIEELKKKAEENNKTTTELKLNLALLGEQLDAVRRQNTVVLIKVEKIYDLMVGRDNNK